MFMNPTQVTSRMMLHSSFKKAYFEISAEPAVSATKNESKGLKCQRVKLGGSRMIISLRYIIYIIIKPWYSLSLTNSYLALSILSLVTLWNKNKGHYANDMRLKQSWSKRTHMDCKHSKIGFIPRACKNKSWTVNRSLHQRHEIKTGI